MSKQKGKKIKKQLKRRLLTWVEGKILELLNKGQALQNRLEMSVEKKEK